jgi:hypothetical protein
MRVILITNAADGTAPVDWENNLQLLRQTPEYHATLEEFEPLIAQIEQGAPENDLIESLQKMLAGTPVN